MRKKALMHMMVLSLISIFIFYIVPMLATKADSDWGLILSLFILIGVNSLYFLLTTFFYSFKFGFSQYGIAYLILISVLFVPSVFLLYNTSALCYVAIYFAVGVFGGLIANSLRKK